jgi:hypothetical protein
VLERLFTSAAFKLLVLCSHLKPDKILNWREESCSQKPRPQCLGARQRALWKATAALQKEVLTAAAGCICGCLSPTLTGVMATGPDGEPPVRPWTAPTVEWEHSHQGQDFLYWSSQDL